MNMNCFGLVCVVSSWLRVSSVAADNFGWVVADGFRWCRVVLNGFEWFRVVYCLSSYGLRNGLMKYS